jgi:hypothetical protein
MYPAFLPPGRLDPLYKKSLMHRKSFLLPYMRYLFLLSGGDILRIIIIHCCQQLINKGFMV